jgi:hypothetical protein
MPRTLDALLISLEASKNDYARGASARIERLLDQLSRQDYRQPKSLLRFHESLLFLRAFPHSQSVVKRIEKLLNTFRLRVEKLRDCGADMSAFDDFDYSGIVGTTMQDTLGFEVGRWVARRIPHKVEIAWDDYLSDYQAERAMESTWPLFIPLLAEDADVEANIPWRRWLDAARGRERELDWIIRRFEQLAVSARQRAELYDSLRLPLRWHLKNLKLSRTRNWTRPRKFYFHTEPLITRSQVSLSDELAKPAPRLAKLSRREGEAVMHSIREVMLVRYRELYGTTVGDPNSVVRADLGPGEAGRGVTVYLWSLPPERRLPLRAYVAGFTLKNGVPINYIEAIGVCEWIEVGFNTFYTYRHGETAWVYAQALRCLCALTGATTISVYPYQIGQNNDEAIDSGAFWFYRKLGFRSGAPELELLARREEKKIAANSQYRSPKKTLEQLAKAHVFYELARTGKGTTSSSAARAVSLLPPSAADGMPGPWDIFSTRNLALGVNQRMAREFDGDSTNIREASVKKVARALHFNPLRWSTAERRALENWSLILALMPDLGSWSPQEKRDLIKVIRSQTAPDEMRYLHLTQRHQRLRAALLRLGSRLGSRE